MTKEQLEELRAMRASCGPGPWAKPYTSDQAIFLSILKGNAEYLIKTAIDHETSVEALREVGKDKNLWGSAAIKKPITRDLDFRYACSFCHDPRGDLSLSVGKTASICSKCIFSLLGSLVAVGEERLNVISSARQPDNKARDVLARLEWGEGDGWSSCICPDCDAREANGHDEDCELAEALK